MDTREVVIPVSGAEPVSGVVTLPQTYGSRQTPGAILAHGAGNDMNNPLLVVLAEGLADAGWLTLRFNFPYRDQGRKAPDSQQVLVQTWQAVYRFLAQHADFGTDIIVAAGKSMGGRVASQMVADGLLTVQRLVFLGYPLHAPGRKDQLRDAHLYRIQIPMLFFAGTRDTLCDLELLRMVLKQLEASWTLDVIDGGDHSFLLPATSSSTQQAVFRQILRKTLTWLNSSQD
jgi:predicted alpha/beta-hydrolase family hydrolase